MINSDGMGTRRPRVCGYITDELNTKVDWLLNEEQCTQSSLVEECVKALAGMDKGDIRKLRALAQKNKRSLGDEASILLSEKLNKIN